jgi:ribosome-binding protein aMBF1 (putative translation factor)
MLLKEIIRTRIIEIQKRQQPYPIVFPKEYKIKSECEICGSIIKLLRHHITYTPVELITVCSKCHGLIHSKDIVRNTYYWKFQKPIAEQIEEKIDPAILKELDELEALINC